MLGNALAPPPTPHASPPHSVHRIHCVARSSPLKPRSATKIAAHAAAMTTASIALDERGNRLPSTSSPATPYAASATTATAASAAVASSAGSPQMKWSPAKAEDRFPGIRPVPKKAVGRKLVMELDAVPEDDEDEMGQMLSGQG